MSGLYITGYHGCNCHPFKTWEECDKYHKQKVEVEQRVRRRCNGKEGAVHRIHPERGYVSVKYGNDPSDIHLEHVANLIKI